MTSNQFLLQQRRFNYDAHPPSATDNFTVVTGVKDNDRGKKLIAMIK
jgi:hypothetical protein